MFKYILTTAWLLASPVVAQQAYNCNAPVTQQEMNICAWQGYQAADGDLNFDYKRALTYLKEADAYIPEDGLSGAIMLRNAQRA